MSIDIGEMRMKNRGRDDTFLESDLFAKEPYGQFKAWFEEACANKNILEPNAMCVSTVSREGKPSARYVLCKYICKEGFKFFTNYESRKAKDLEANQNIALTFYWDVLNRSVRIEGVAEKVSDEESEKYFHQRPVPSQIIACTSRQSEPIESREVLYEREKDLEVKFKNSDKVPKPKLWGGYLVRPTSMEFWQGQQDRLSDRINFRKPNEGEVPDGKILHQGEDGWVYERLSP